MDNEETVDLEDEITDEETLELEETIDSDEKDWKAEALKYQAILKRQKEKAEKAPEVKEADKETDIKTNQSEYLTRDEGILIAQGISDESLKQLHAISKGKGISLIEAKSDPLCEAYEQATKEEQRKADAKLGASNSSGRTPKGKPISEMTKEEHEAYWREKNGL